MSLAAGGHLTHGAAPNLSKISTQQYGVSETTAEIDFDELQNLAEQHKPKIILAGGSAYPRTLDFAAFRKIADSVGAYLGGYGAFLVLSLLVYTRHRCRMLML